MKLAAAIISLFLASSLFGGGLLHAVVPHEHGESHSSSETIWASLHGALAHEQKDILFTLPFVLIAIALSIVFAPIFALKELVLQPRLDELRRGVAMYRRFT